MPAVPWLLNNSSNNNKNNDDDDSRGGGAIGEGLMISRCWRAAFWQKNAFSFVWSCNEGFATAQQEYGRGG